MGKSRKFSILVLASGGGSTFEAVVEASKKSESLFEVNHLIVNRDDILAIGRAKRLSVPVKVVSSAQYPFEIWENEIYHSILGVNPDLIVLAGFLKKVPLAVVKKFSGQIINTHPSLLPKFGGQGMYGVNVHKAVFESGDRESGVTVHWVSEHYDEGAIIGQKKCDISSCETFNDVEAQVQSIEKPFLVEIINKILSERLSRL